MKPFITWERKTYGTIGIAGTTRLFSIMKVSTTKHEDVYELHADIVNKHMSYYRTEEDAKQHAELAVEHFLKRLGFWQCIVDRENQGA